MSEAPLDYVHFAKGMTALSTSVRSLSSKRDASRGLTRNQIMRNDDARMGVAVQKAA